MLTSRRWPVSFDYRVEKERQVLQGWINYYVLAKCRRHMLNLDGWLRRKFRQCIWKTWILTRTKMRNLIKLGIPKEKAYMWVHTRKRYWVICKSPILQTSIHSSLYPTRLLCAILSFNHVPMKITNKQFLKQKK